MFQICGLWAEKLISFQTEICPATPEIKLRGPLVVDLSVD